MESKIGPLSQVCDNQSEDSMGLPTILIQSSEVTLKKSQMLKITDAQKSQMLKFNSPFDGQLKVKG